MSILFDLIILVVIALSLINGWRIGLVKSVMDAASAVLSFFAAMFFTPFLGPFIAETFIKGALSAEVSETLTSLLGLSGDGAGRTTEQLFANMSGSRLPEMLARFGVDTDKFVEQFSSSEPATRELVTKMSDAIVTPVAYMVAGIVAFILIFVVTAIILKIVTAVIGVAFELPALKQFNEVAGLAFGAVSAVFYAIVLSNVFVHLAGTLSVFDPTAFSADMIEETYLVRLFSGLRLSMLTDILSNIGGVI